MAVFYKNGAVPQRELYGSSVKGFGVDIRQV